MHWKSAQYAAADRFPCLVALNFLLATSLESASPTARVIAVLNSSHVLYVLRPWLLTGGSLVTDGRVTQNLRKEKVRSNNSNDGNYLLLWGSSRNQGVVTYYNLKLCCLSQGAFEVVDRNCIQV
jgi:hypothetical protein